MVHKNLFRGLMALGAGLLTTSLSSLVARFDALGTAIDFTSGLLDGLSAVIFVVAIVLLLRGWRASQGSARTDGRK